MLAVKHIKLIMLLSLLCCMGGCQHESEPILAMPTDVVVKTAVSTPTPTAIPTNVPTPTPTATPPPPLGSAYVIMSVNDIRTLMRFDLDSNEQTALFTVPDEGWLATADLNNAGDHFVLSYAPPDEEGIYGFTRLYLMANEANAPLELLIEPERTQDLFFHPVWSVNGRFIYYAHTALTKTTEGTLTSYDYLTQLKRMEVESGDIVTLADNASWPQISPDGEQLVYVQADAETTMDTLILADKNGNNSQTLIGSGEFEAIDAPLFSPDGEAVYFSAAEPEEAGLLLTLLGVKTAHAHDIAANWYRLPLSASNAEPERLTTIDALNLYGRFSPTDPDLFMFSADSGLYQMSADGGDLHQLLKYRLLSTLGWQ